MNEKQNIRLVEGVAFAAQLHATQFRRGSKTPYLSHLLAVAALVMEDGGSEDEVIAALLHDSIEDQGDRYVGGRPALRNHIGKEFGRVVLDIVNACTDDDGYDKGSYLTPEAEKIAWRRRKQEYLDHLQEVSDHRVLRVSCADKLHNARTLLTDHRELGDSLWERFTTKSRTDQMWVYQNLCDVYLTKGVGRLAVDLKATLNQFEE